MHKFLCFIVTVNIVWQACVAQESQDDNQSNAGSGANGSIIYFDNLSAFQAVAPDTSTALFDVDNNSTSNPFLELCSSVVNSSTNDDCFVPDQVPDGVEFSSSDGSVVIVIPAGAPDAPRALIGGNSFTIGTATVIDFLSDDVQAVAMTVINYGIEPSDITITIFDGNGIEIDNLIFPQVAPAPAEGIFLGVIASIAIGSIMLDGEDSLPETVNDLRFGPSQAIIFRNGFE